MSAKAKIFAVFAFATIGVLCVLPNLMKDDDDVNAVMYSSSSSSSKVIMYDEDTTSYSHEIFFDRRLDDDDDDGGDDDDSNCTHYHDTCEEVKQNCALGTAGTQLFNIHAAKKCNCGWIHQQQYGFRSWS